MTVREQQLFARLVDRIITHSEDAILAKKAYDLANHTDQHGDKKLLADHLAFLVTERGALTEVDDGAN